MMNIKTILLLSLAAYALCGDNKLPENELDLKNQKIDSEVSISAPPKSEFDDAKAKAMEYLFKEALSCTIDNNTRKKPSNIRWTDFATFAIIVDKNVLNTVNGLCKENHKQMQYYYSLDFAKFKELVGHICKEKSITVQEFAEAIKKERDERK
ncbi:uncharacterized protein LOC126842059 [Adelges cooleyi]|uniref:uncharacterized protein LOC126842059 n=1 Tax=Adelges cooleyi TaxID=133065 RepID=UPI0021808DF5|nr:uncharacterized protein LOC126842059 [Adelges cooleyi]